ncbi:ankyrin repeat domain-containing protein [Spiroplasma endosymbiont of Eupeodes luniger]|uniref:ankyrin repeat domain-containing protein n=1 Tax=Spiroplasma endosymbiont of Eupeodes luniger TaxID=3066300 RepID=UPI0030D00EDF
MLPQGLQKQLLTIEKQFSNYVNYSVVELTSLKMKFAELQKSLDTADEKEQLDNYLRRIDYRIRAWATNYNAQQLDEILNRLEQLIASEDIIAIGELLENTPTDLNINAPIFINNEAIENRFREIEFNKSLPVLKILINYGLNSNFWNNYDNTLLHIEVLRKNIEVIQLLLNNGTNINMKNQKGESPLFWAVKNQSMAIIELLLDWDADVNIKNNIDELPLHYAVLQENIAIMELLLDWDADVNIKNNIDELPLHYAVLQENIAIMELLLDRGADANIQNEAGDSPIFVAIELMNIPIIELLLARGANINI